MIANLCLIEYLHHQANRKIMFKDRIKSVYWIFNQPPLCYEKFHIKEEKSLSFSIHIHEFKNKSFLMKLVFNLRYCFLLPDSISKQSQQNMVYPKSYQKVLAPFFFIYLIIIKN